MKKILLLFCFLSISIIGITADRYWVALVAGNWNSSANWSSTSGGAGGASVPGSSDRAIFDTSSIGVCNINANVNVLNFVVRNSFIGAIYQGNSYTITIASGGSFDCSGGAFVGGNSNITISGSFTLDSNAIFTSTSATLAIRDAVTIDDGDDFIHNSGLLSLTSLAAGSTVNVDLDTVDLYNFKVDDAAGLKNITFGSDNVITVNNNFTLTGSTTSYEIFLFGGKIYCKKNIYVSYRWSHTVGQGTTEVIVNGTGTQIIDGTGNLDGALFKLTINKGSDTLKFKGPLNIQNDLTLTSGIVVFESTSAIEFYYGFTIDGNFNFDQLTFNATIGTYADTWTINDVLTTNDDLIFKGNKVVYLLGGEIHCKGDFDLSTNTVGNGTSTSSTYIGTTEIYFDSNSNQSWIGRSSSSSTWMPVIIIDKSGGTLTLSGNISIGGELSYVQGTIDYGTSTIAFVKNCDITGNSFSLYNVTIRGVIGYNSAIYLSDSTILTVIGTYSLTGSSTAAYLTNGTIHCKGNITVTNTDTAIARSYNLIINGTGNQTLTGNNNDNTGFLHNVEINKSSGILYLSSLFSLSGSWIYKNGTIDATTNSSTIYFNLNHSPTIKGNHTLNKMHLYNSGSNKKFIIANGTTITLEDEFRAISTGTNVIDSGTVEVKGNIISANTLNGGTATLKAIGTANQTFTGTTNLTTGELPNFTMNKSAGTFTVTDYLNVAKTLTLTNGIITTANGSSKVHLIDNATLSGGSTSSYVDGIVSKLGNDAFTFPVGESGLYRPLAMTAPSSTSDRFETEYFAKGQSLGTTFDTAYVQISANEYWQFSRSVGSSTVKATMNWSNNKFEIPGDSTTLGSLYWTGSTWTGIANDLLTGNATNGSLRGATLTTYSYLVLGKKKEKNVFVTTHYKLDGGFYKTKTKRLYVKYKGEYNAAQFRFTIYDEDNDIVADQNTAGVVDRYYVKEGDNRFIFNFSPNGYAIPNGFYILEIVNDKNEKQYLRFQKLL